MFDRSLEENKDFTKLEDFNDHQLELLKNDIEALINLQVDGQGKLLDMMAYVRKQLILNKIYLNLDAGINSLKEILANHLLEQVVEQKNDNHHFNAELNNWCQKYPQLIQAEKAATVGLYKAYQDDIMESLLKTGVAPQTEGSGRDADFILNDHISDPDTVEIISNKAYLFKSVAIVSSEVEASNQDAVDLLVKKIMPVLEKSKDQQNVTVGIPVSTQAHWRLFVAEINYGKITEAVLLDSAEGDNEDLTVVPAYLNAQQAVDKVCEETKAEPVVIKPVMTGKQTNGFSCMDYVVQAAITIKSRKNNEELEDTLQDIVKADNARSLRTAVIEQIASQHPEVRKQINKQSFMTETLHKSASGELKPKTNKWEEFAALVFSKAETDETSIEAKVPYTVVLSANDTVEKAEHEVDVTETSQIELDEEYAKRLHEELNTEFDDEKFARELQAQFDEEDRQNRISYRG